MAGDLRSAAVPLTLSLLLLAVVLTLHNDVKYRTLHFSAHAELLGGVSPASIVKTAAMEEKTSHAQVGNSEIILPAARCCRRRCVFPALLCVSAV